MSLIGTSKHLQVVDTPAGPFDRATRAELADAALFLLGALVDAQVTEHIAKNGGPKNFTATQRAVVIDSIRRELVGYARTPSSANPRVAALRAIGEGTA